MSSSFGTIVKVSVFGQSHSEAIGAVVDGLPSGEAIDMERVRAFMRRRAPGNAAHATKRREKDEPKVLSGLVDGKTCGAPLMALIENTDQRSGDYDALKNLPRPGHADFTARVKYGDSVDLRGGGHFSGRLTAPICFAGAVAKQILERHGVSVRARIYEIAGIRDAFDGDMAAVEAKEFPVFDDRAGVMMREAIERARLDGDSVGGVVECVAEGLPAGLGEPMMDSVESTLARLMFSIPAVRGVEFGAGFAAARMRGSAHNDAFYVENGRIVTKTNRHAGVLGGITTGMPVIFRVAFKPTSSIAKPQRSVNLTEMREETLTVGGRHDPCVVPRAVPVVEAMAALALIDLYMIHSAQKI
jgi:chorismate synthase